jgi:hypothetical protein
VVFNRQSAFPWVPTVLPFSPTMQTLTNLTEAQNVDHSSQNVVNFFVLFERVLNIESRLKIAIRI